MSHHLDIARESLGTLLSDVVVADRFVKWKATITDKAGSTLSRYAFGDIFWKKSLGRPTSTSLSDGFKIEAWRVEMELAGDVGGAAHWQPLPVFYGPTWWDGKDDGEYWRVVYMVPNMDSGVPSSGLQKDATYSYIVPKFNWGVGWSDSDARIELVAVGPRAFEPPGAVFVKGDAPVHFSFEVVRRPLLVSP